MSFDDRIGDGPTSPEKGAVGLKGGGVSVTVRTGAKQGVFRTIPFVNLQRLHQMMGSSLDAAFFNVVKDASFTMGPKLEAFEDNFAAYIGVRHAVGVGSGTDALHFALRACGVGPGDEVITVVNTFAATAEAI